ncbi:hypothetical protein EJ05DRAFT_176922 [Pseudovirgaria hyperparasitica]|uniref:DUF7918 domain-containing protein n=1 Tax=Pseudovirgaria hyperparasitica TaxID=470096 RepID=A0A6A6WHL8_9PEZI|nr:uncharacterized protein EJ05DRAFT_176922 [Pseudovirgaria hyperparasitica]KAF2761574.1 hypothetical protein EJ05DRAFT_176922 [Pseudovirgaria hyperparasitica]
MIIDGVEVSIVSATTGLPLREYLAPDDAKGETQNVRYIESIAGEQFSIIYKLHPEFKRLGCSLVSLYRDAWKTYRPIPKVINSPIELCKWTTGLNYLDGKWYEGQLAFSDYELQDESTEDDQSIEPGVMKLKVVTRVQVSRTRMGAS